MKQRRYIAVGMLLVAGFLTDSLFARIQGVQSGVPVLAGIFTGRRCVPANSPVCPEMSREGAEKLLTARARAFRRRSTNWRGFTADVEDPFEPYSLEI